MADVLAYDHERDFKAVLRIHREVGWVENKAQAKALEKLAPRCAGLVFPVRGEAECAVFTSPGAMRFQDEDLDMSAVLAVTTSRVARKLGAAKRLTARALADAAAAGHDIAMLGMFEQGFYDRLGFGTGAYANVVRFDPATLTVDAPFRPPRRLERRDWRKIHRAMHERARGHGGCVLHEPRVTHSDMAHDNLVALGYFDGPDETLSHFFCGEAKNEHGPYDVYAYAYQTPEQLFELLAVMKSLADQVSSFAMIEPAEIQLQDLLRQPFRHRRGGEGSKHAGFHRANAYWQARILNLAQCMAKTRLAGEPVDFRLRLRDPVAECLDDDCPWRGVAGDYSVTLGEQSRCTPDEGAQDQPTLTASVGAFTRMWLGVRPASSLALTDDLRGDARLLRDLDRLLRLPPPQPGWDF